MASSIGSIFRVTGHLGREFTGHRWIPLSKACDEELWCSVLFLICAWMDGWVNSREAGDLRRHRAYNDVTVMETIANIDVTWRMQQMYGCVFVPEWNLAKLKLTHWVPIITGLYNSLSPLSTKPFHEPIMEYHQFTRNKIQWHLNQNVNMYA